MIGPANRRGLDYLLKKLRETGTAERTIGSGRRRSSRTTQNIDAVVLTVDLIVSQEDKPGTHRSTRQIARETGVSQSTVVRIVHEDLSMFQATQSPGSNWHHPTGWHAESDRDNFWNVTQSTVALMWFTDEKIFTVAAPSNLQNDRVYAARDTKFGLIESLSYPMLVKTAWSYGY